MFINHQSPLVVTSFKPIRCMKIKVFKLQRLRNPSCRFRRLKIFIEIRRIWSLTRLLHEDLEQVLHSSAIRWPPHRRGITLCKVTWHRSFPTQTHGVVKKSLFPPCSDSLGSAQKDRNRFCGQVLDKTQAHVRAFQVRCNT